LLRFII